jgi:hypothetical protein
MRDTLIRFGLAAALVLGAAAGPCRSDSPGNEFFNGKDLEGWQGLTDYWSVKDGALVGADPKGLTFNTFLCSKKSYKDFELHFQVRLTGDGWTGNSGVQIRSAVFNLEHYAVRGPQCDIGEGYWASLYGEHIGGMMKQAPREVLDRVLKKDEFNDYYIRCVGQHVTIKLNGETTVDDDFPQMREEGLIAWQIHQGRPMEVVFKNIEFTPLTQKK